MAGNYLIYSNSSYKELYFNSQISKLDKYRKMKATRIVQYAANSSSIKGAAHPLLPPLLLYRRILKAHKSLPTLQRDLGNKYVRNEFKLHKDVENPLHIVGFLASWQAYLHSITNGAWASESLTPDMLDKMSPEQAVQLYELMKETQKVAQGSKK